MAAEADGDAAPIAAFEVAKGGVVLKHVFLNAPPPEIARLGGGGVEDEEDPPVMVGRHPDCHVLVDHPSVSRFHLELRSRRRQRRITVTDLSSVHGTWVAGRRIPPNTPVDLAADDTLRLGASKREYRLLWLSLREAFEMEDPLPPLLEDDKEGSRADLEASNKVVPEQRETADTETHQETRQKIAPEEIDFPAEVIPSAPPLPELAQSFYLEESAPSQFHEDREAVLHDQLVDKSPITESFGSLIIQEMPATLTNVGQEVQSSKRDASSQVSKRAKLKSVKSLRIDTGRSRERSSALSYNFQKVDQNEILVCSQNCGTECTACIALFGISEFEGTKEKEEVIADDKGHMNPPASITMEGNRKEPNHDNYIPQGSDFADQEIPRWSAATVNMEPSENPFLHEVKHDNLTTLNLEGDLNNENIAPSKIAECPEEWQLEGTVCGNLFDNLDTEGTEENKENSPLDKENITPYMSGNIITERSHRGLKPAISQELMDSMSPLNLEHDSLSENGNSMLSIHQMNPNEPIFENLNLLMSADVELQKTDFMPISHLDFKDDILLYKENSVLAPKKFDDPISPVRQEDLFSDKENVTPTSRDLKPIGRRVLGSRRDKPVSAENSSNKGILKLECNELPVKSKGIHTVDDDAFYSDKENLTPISSGGMKARKSLLKTNTADADQDQEAFCSDKENLTPQSSAAQKTRDMSENRARIESAITKKRVVDRLPFQTLMSNSPLRPTSSPDCRCAVARPGELDAGGLAIRLEDQLNKIPHKIQESDRDTEGMKVWTMVPDTDCLLDDESRKSIMLLKGIKGTHLIIPMIVIRELDCLKQREGLFRRPSKATSILQWIEECMENESWWIHVQSSSDMLPVAPTPPATPTMQFNDEDIEIAAGSFNPMALFSPRSFADIISPKPEDRVLECALLFNKLRSKQNIVVLSNSITLKIKAMAEGLPCEGAKEFRESLMNPCSSRFMWAASAPRGSAWSSLDAAALAENYYNSHHHGRKRIPRPAEAAKGLKLILRHNSLYAQAGNPVRRAPLASLASV
ncbi:hypothetical protein ACP70R_003915 [Stipagrostis hirtigluma subsp. patula]